MCPPGSGAGIDKNEQSSGEKVMTTGLGVVVTRQGKVLANKKSGFKREL